MTEALSPTPSNTYETPRFVHLCKRAFEVLPVTTLTEKPYPEPVFDIKDLGLLGIVIIDYTAVGKDPVNIKEKKFYPF
jgi:hypothetical protein